MEKHIYLNGFMGAGKSKVGPKIAKLLNCSFYDTDNIIEQNSGKTVAEIFEQDGEETFRKKEGETISELSNYDKRAIVALGGGALTNPEIKNMVEEHGIVVYLKSSPETILSRVRRNTRRPLLNIKRDEFFEENLLKKINEILADRKEMYESAHIIIARDNLKPQQVAEKIYIEVEKYEKNRS